MTKSEYIAKFFREHTEIEEAKRLAAANKGWRAYKEEEGTDAKQRADRESILKSFEESPLSRVAFEALISGQPESIQRNKAWWEKIWLMTVRLHEKSAESAKSDRKAA